MDTLPQVSHAPTQGFTAIELMLALAVLGILLGIGLPNFNDALQRVFGRTIPQELFTAYQYARHEAVKTGQALTLCGSNDGIHCLREWQHQLITFNDLNNNKKMEANEKIRSFEFNYHDVTIFTKMAFGQYRLHLSADGTIKHGGGFVYCKKNRAKATRKITFNALGRPYFANLSFRDGIVRDINNQPVSCQ